MTTKSPPNQSTKSKTSNGISKPDEYVAMMATMFEKVIDQMKRDQQQLIEVITNKFDNQIRDLQVENSELKSKLAVLEHRIATTQINMLNNTKDTNNTKDNIAFANGPNQRTNFNQQTSPSKPTYASKLTGNGNIKPFTKLVKGTGEDKWTLKSAPAREFPAKIFITRLAPEVEAQEVSKHIKETFNLELEVEKVETKYPTYSSFMIKTTSVNFKILLDEANAEKWPRNAALRRWYEPRPRHAEDSERPATDSRTQT